MIRATTGAIAATLLAGAASAVTIEVDKSTVGTVIINPGPGSGVFPDDATARIYRSDAFGFGAGFAAFTDLDDRSIYFENGAMSASAFNGARAVTSVDIQVTNTGVEPTLDRMVSTLFESSFGFYMGRFGPGGCTGLHLPDCAQENSGRPFGSFLLAPGSTRTAPGTSILGLAGVSFAFDVLYDGALARSIGGNITMVANPGGGISFIEDFGAPGPDNLFSALNGFALQSTDGYRHVWGWDTTPFEVDFAQDLLPGNAATVTYRITTESWSQAVNPDRDSRNMIVGFACVRDPVGRTGDESEQFAMGGIARSLVDPLLDNTCQDELPFQSNVLNLPVVKDGILIFQSPIPEPATWGMMIAGFGLVGAALRRRQTVTA